MSAAAAGKVLIVEDEALILCVAQAEFEDAGYRVIAAADSAEALAALGSNPDLDVLFTDIRIPGALDGWALARSARQIMPGLAVIYATGFSQDEAAPVEGGLLFMKPYRLSHIIEAVRTLPRRR
jgi:CheY-like chemotaxis protein